MNEPIATIIGNVTAEPEVKYGQNGAARLNFTIASTPRSFDRQANEWKDGETLFMRATAFRELAENLGQALHKGTKVIAQGRLSQHSYETKEGEKRTSLELLIDDIGIVVPRNKPNAQRAGSQPQQNYQPPQVPQQQDSWPVGEYDPNAPF